METELKHQQTAINKQPIDFKINADVMIRFLYMTSDYTACIYYKGMFDGRVQNMRYKKATKEEAQTIYIAYLEQENKRMRDRLEGK